MRDYTTVEETKIFANEWFKKIYDDGYKHGYLDGKDESYKNSVPTQNAYNCGLEDAWELAKKLVLHPVNGGLDNKNINKIFYDLNYYDVLEGVSVHEVKEKIEAWEKKKKEEDKPIPIGTIVFVQNIGYKGIITGYNSDDDAEYAVMNKDGDVTWYGEDELYVYNVKCDLKSCLEMLEMEE